jgi:hypothetical protein
MKIPHQTDNPSTLRDDEGFTRRRRGLIKQNGTMNIKLTTLPLVISIRYQWPSPSEKDKLGQQNEIESEGTT